MKISTCCQEIRIKYTSVGMYRKINNFFSTSCSTGLVCKLHCCWGISQVLTSASLDRLFCHKAVVGKLCYRRESLQASISYSPSSQVVAAVVISLEPPVGCAPLYKADAVKVLYRVKMERSLRRLFPQFLAWN